MHEKRVPSHYLFREAHLDDHPAMAELYQACVERADWLSAQAKAAADWERDAAGERQFVVEEVNEVVGFISIWEPDAFIHLLFVHPDHHGQGVGSLLLRGLAAHLPFPWRLKCTCANRRARDFYQKRGWQWLERGDSHGELYDLLVFGGAE